MSVVGGWMLAVGFVVLCLGILLAVYIASVRAPVREDEGDLYRSRRIEP